MLARLQRFRFDWKLTLLTAMLLPVLVSLGFWQLEREQEKRQLEQLYESRQQQSPAELHNLDAGDDHQYRQVQLRGTYDNEHIFLLDNRIFQGQPGYEILQALKAESDRLVFVNRGWVPQGAYRTDLPPIDAIEGPVELRGTLYAPLGEQLVLGPELAAAGWPKVIQVADVDAMARLAGYDPADEVFAYTVRLMEGTANVPPGYWPIVSLSAQMHRGYAVQWFAMAAVLLALYFFHSTRGSRSASAAHDDSQ